MREIKFRAWDKDNGMTEPFKLSANGAPVVLFRRDIEVMQYTGLKDKNGKEIYEGDIVKDVHEDQVVGAIQWGWNSFNLESPYDITNYEPAEELEIIGNIYQNPDLLTHEK